MIFNSDLQEIFDNGLTIIAMVPLIAILITIGIVIYIMLKKGK